MLNLQQSNTQYILSKPNKNVIITGTKNKTYYNKITLYTIHSEIHS